MAAKWDNTPPQNLLILACAAGSALLLFTLKFGFDAYYDGMMAAIPRYFLDQPWAAADLEKFRMGWFIEFIRKLTHREDFTLDELRAAAKANGVKPFSR